MGGGVTLKEEWPTLKKAWCSFGGGATFKGPQLRFREPHREGGVATFKGTQLSLKSSTLGRGAHIRCPHMKGSPTQSPAPNTCPTAATGTGGSVGVGVETQVGIPGAEDELLLAGSPSAGIGVFLPDMALDGAELEGGEGAAANHAEHPVSRRVELHQVFGSPAFVVIPTVIPTRDTAPTRPRRSSFAVV